MPTSLFIPVGFSSQLGHKYLIFIKIKHFFIYIMIAKIFFAHITF